MLELLANINLGIFKMLFKLTGMMQKSSKKEHNIWIKLKQYLCIVKQEQEVLQHKVF